MGAPPSKVSSLLSDYCSLEGDSHARLTDTERLTFVGGDDLAKVFRRLERTPLSLSFKDLFATFDEQKIDDYHRYYSPLLGACGQKVFAPPTGVITPKIIPVHGLSHEGEIVDLEFASAFTSEHPQFETIKVSIPENSTVRVRYWRHHEGQRPTLVCVHGWTMNDPRVNALAFLPGFYFRLGFDVALFELPFHGRRLNAEFKDAGHSLFPSGNIMLTNEAILQSVSDLRQLKLILRALGTKKVGVLGVSLGAYIATVWSCLDKLECGIMMLPFGSFGTLAAHHGARQGISQDILSKLEASFAFHSPLHISGATEQDRLMFISSAEDSVIPVDEIRKLEAKFAASQFLSVSGDHSVATSRDQILQATGQFLNRF